MAATSAHAVEVELAVAEDPRGDDDVRRAGVEPAAGVVEVHTAAEVQAAGKGRERRTRRFFVASTKLDDVPARELVALVEFREPRRGPFAHEVGAQARPAVLQRAADDLLHLAFVQVNAGTEHARSLKLQAPSSKLQAAKARRHGGRFRRMAFRIFYAAILLTFK